MTVVSVNGDDAGVLDGVVDAERARTVVAGRAVVLDGGVEVVVVVVLVFELGNPLRARAVEDELQVVLGVLGELAGGFEAVDEPTEVAVGFGACQKRARERSSNEVTGQ